MSNLTLTSMCLQRSKASHMNKTDIVPKFSEKTFILQKDSEILAGVPKILLEMNFRFRISVKRDDLFVALEMRLTMMIYIYQRQSRSSGQGYVPLFGVAVRRRYNRRYIGDGKILKETYSAYFISTIFILD